MSLSIIDQMILAWSHLQLARYVVSLLAMLLIILIACRPYDEFRE